MKAPSGAFHFGMDITLAVKGTHQQQHQLSHDVPGGVSLFSTILHKLLRRAVTLTPLVSDGAALTRRARPAH